MFVQELRETHFIPYRYLWLALEESVKKNIEREIVDVEKFGVIFGIKEIVTIDTSSVLIHRLHKTVST